MKRPISKELEEHFNKEHDFRNILKDINLKKDINSYEQLSFIEHIWVYGMTSLKPMAWVLSKANTQKIYQFKGRYHCTKMKFSTKDFFSTCNQIRSLLRLWSHLVKKFLMENFIFCAVYFQICTKDCQWSGHRLLVNSFTVDWFNAILRIAYFCLISKRSLYHLFYYWDRGAHAVIITVFLVEMFDRITFNLVIAKL